MRLVPPAGYPLKINQIFRALKNRKVSQRSPDSNLRELGERLRRKYVFGVSSGRAGLALVFKSLCSLSPNRRIVALPAYTCFTVAASVVRSGLRLLPVDIDPATLDFDFSQLEAVPKEGLLCIVTSNLFGIVNDLRRIREIARAKGTYVIDDAAQALGASRNGYDSGGGGDVGIYSLGRGKALPAIEGGLIVTESDEIANVLRMELVEIPSASTAHSAFILLQMLGFSVFMNPSLYWIPNAIPFLNLGATEFAPDFVVAGLSGLSHALLRVLMEGTVDVNGVRRANAAKIMAAISPNSSFSTPRPATGSLPTYLRFPVIARDEVTRDEVVAKLRAAGIGAGPFYPTAVCDIPGIDRHMASTDFHCSKAESLSKRLFTLPVHPYVEEGDMARMLDVLNSMRTKNSAGA